MAMTLTTAYINIWYSKNFNNGKAENKRVRHEAQYESQAGVQPDTSQATSEGKGERLWNPDWRS